MKSVFNVIGLTEEAIQMFYSFYSKSVIPLLEFWQIQYLPNECKIDICFYDKKDFIKILQGRSLSINNSIIAISDVQIHAIKYEFINKYFSAEMYEKVLLHECVHMLQLYFSRIPFKNHIWLYESIACYMTRQMLDIKPSTIPDWSCICNNFYSCENCYYWAYEIGKCLFENYSQNQIHEICGNPQLAKKSGKLIWHTIESTHGIG